MNLDPHATAVVAVHWQADVVTPEGAFGGFFADEVARTGVIATAKTLLDAARSAGSKIVYTRVAYKPGHTDLVANSPLLDMVVQNQCLVDGTPAAEIIDTLAPHEQDSVITHQRVTGFAGTQLDVLLRGSGIDTVALAGVATNISVEGTARDASNLGYRTIVVSDACAAGSEAAHNASLETLSLLGEVATTDDVVAVMQQATSGVSA